MPSAEEKDLIKRVVGVGGDTVTCKGTGPLTVNGKALNEPYVYPGNTPCSQDDQGGQFSVKVPKGYIWVMGDHRQNSRDSRYNQSDKHHAWSPSTRSSAVPSSRPGRSTAGAPCRFRTPSTRTV